MADDSGWVRLERNLPNNYKVAQLDDHDFRIWVLLITIASSDGTLRHGDVTAFALRRAPEEIKATLATLLKLRLVDERRDASGEITLALHDYEEHQGFAQSSAVSTAAERQKRYRNRLRLNGQTEALLPSHNASHNAVVTRDVTQNIPSVQNITPPLGATASHTQQTREETSLRSSKNASKLTQNSKGSRINPAWVPEEEGVNAAYKLGIPYESISNEAARFKDYWIAKPGIDGLKLNWQATWRNWCRKAAELKDFKPTQNSIPLPKPKNPRFNEQGFDTSNNQWKLRIETARKGPGSRFELQFAWPRNNWGPAPGEPNCLIPQHLIVEEDRNAHWREWDDLVAERKASLANSDT